MSPHQTRDDLVHSNARCMDENFDVKKRLTVNITLNTNRLTCQSELEYHLIQAL